MKHISRGAADENDDEDAPTHASTTYGKTQNEVIEDEVVVPDISEVDPHEPLEQVGEIINILNNKIVIVKGIASQISDRASEKALDSDTLLVFEDRKVMGFVSNSLDFRFWFFEFIFSRFMKRLGRLTNRSIKYVSAESFLWIWNGHESLVLYFTCPIAASSFSLVNCNSTRVVMLAMRMTKNLGKTKWSSPTTSKKLRTNVSGVRCE
jgi:hypothetical protein